MSDSPIDDIKSRLDIVEVISSYIKLQKTGANYRANCPFHTEKTPSFFVSPARQIWHCFGCSKGGDAFSFVKEIEGVEFGDALKILAQKAGVELKPFRPEFKEMNTRRSRLYEICELSASFFEKQLGNSAAGKDAKDYLLKRGINEESIKQWRLGYAPDTWSGLTDFLTGRGYKEQEIVEAGLAIAKDQDSPGSRGIYDRFRGRIIFPVSDIASQIVGFGGRVFLQKDAKEIAKYINTPATILYDKSRVLYGLEKAKVAIRQKDSCILVEGYTDAILSHQAGVANAMAISGTALTPQHLKILRRYTENLKISFDMDVAGDTATKRGINLAVNQGFNIKVITLPSGKDPADLIVQFPGEWENCVDKAESIMEFYFESALKKFDKTKVDGKKEISKILLPPIKKIPNKIEQSFWLQRLGQELAVKEEDLIQEMGKIKIEEDVLGLEPEETINLPSKSRKDLLEERLLILIIKNQKNINEILSEDENIFSAEISKMILVLKKEAVLDRALKNMPSDLADKLNYLSLKSEILSELSEKDQAIDFLDCLREIRTMAVKSRLERISQELRLAEGEKDAKKMESLLEEFHNLSKKLVSSS